MMKKKPISLQPHYSRMQQRVRAVAAMPPAEQGLACYCDGQPKPDFCAAVSAGEESAVNLALDVVAAELWLGPHDAGRYGRAFRAALRRACIAGTMTASQKRVLYSIEMRNLRRLTLRARHTSPGYEQQRAERRLPGQQQVMQLCFGELPELKLDTEELPEVKSPSALLQKAAQYGWFTEETAARMAACEESMLGELVHCPEEVLPSARCLDAMPSHAPETLCYFFCWNGFRSTRWVVAPWGRLGRECGFILAADASFYCNVDEYDRIYENVVTSESVAVGRSFTAPARVKFR